MTLAELIEGIDAAASDGITLTGRPVAVLVRNEAAPFDSDEAFEVRPIVDVAIDDEPSIDLVTAADDTESGLNLEQLRSKLIELSDVRLAHEVYARAVVDVGGDGWVSLDTPLVATLWNEEQDEFAVMQWFEGCDELLR